MTPLLIASERAALALFTGVWHGAVLLAVVAVALRVLPRLTAAARSLIWTAALVVVAALPFLPAPAAVNAASPALRLAPVWSVAIAAVWLILSLVRAGQLAVSGLRLRTIWAEAEPVGGTFRVHTLLGNRTAVLCTSKAVARPSVIGFFAPKILIPHDLYSQLAAEEIEQIVLHEMEHLRRGDDWRNLLQKLAVMLFPLNPALLWIERRLCFERELACDESVLAQTQAPKSYAACLVHLAEAARFGRQISLALGAWERRSELGRRVHGILSSPKKLAASHRLRLVSTGGLLAGMLAVSAGLAHAPQLIAFAAPAAFETNAPAAPSAFENAGVRQRIPAAHMVETMMRVPAPVKVRKIPAKTQRKPQPRLVAERQAAASRVLLTAWDADQAMPMAPAARRVTFAIFEFSSYSFGTAPVGRLIIVQL